MNKKVPVSVALAITIIAMTVTFSITWLLSMYTFNNTVSAVTQLQAEYAKLAEIDNYVRGNFYGDIDNDYLFDRVALGYVNGLGDRYSTYYTEAEYTELLDYESGKLVDVGLEIIRDADGSYRIARVYPDSPAFRAGLTKNGVILTVNGVETSSITSVRALQSALRGEEGTDVVLECIYGVADRASFTIHRSSYFVPTVEWQKLGDYAYVRISAFNTKTANDFEYVIHQAQAAEVKGYLFDLRGTSGGMFRNVYEMIDLICPRGTVAKSLNKTGVISVLATSDENWVDRPMAVLVNEATAGPAELFAASVRDMNGGQIIGTKTLGKGSMQSTPRRLSDGSAVSVTVAMLLTGKDESFDGSGLVPGVELSSEDITEEMLLDPQPLNDAQALRSFEVLRGMVRERGEDPGDPVTPETVGQPVESEAPTEPGGEEDPEADSSEETDASDSEETDASDSTESEVPADSSSDSSDASGG